MIIASCWWGCGVTGVLIHCRWVYKNGTVTWENTWQFLKNVTIPYNLQYDPAIPIIVFKRMKTCVCTKICMWMCVVALFTISKKWWMYKYIVVHPYNWILLRNKMNKLLIHTKWLNLKSIIQSQTQNTTIIPLTWNLRKGKTTVTERGSENCGEVWGEVTDCKGAWGNCLAWWNCSCHACGGGYMTVYICQNLNCALKNQADFKNHKCTIFC